MTTSPSPAAASQSSSNGASPASLPRWRSFLSTLNWRRDPGYEQRTRETEIAILRERQKRLQIEKQIEQIDERTKQIENEIEQLRRENARLKTLLACVDQLCFPPESSSSPPKSTEPDCGPSSP
jgi:septal ring factor EnvC (AmiA/AmiB activator)